MVNESPINSTRLLQRFLRYVTVDTTANPDATHYPSSDGQLLLGKMLVDELLEMGAEGAHQDDHGLVWATVPGNVDAKTATILFNAHVDTSPDASGAKVNPQVINQYAGGDIQLPRDERVITVDSCPALNDLLGHTLITTDGTTLLGGDDKAGVASIMELANHLIENPHLPHGDVRILFTCDEEIGRGAQHMDLAKANADAAYTLDGSGTGIVENENFSADHLVVKALGNNIHPSIGKGRMVNAVRGLSALIGALPKDGLSPETTDAMDGFIHPYLTSGNVESAEAKFLLRDFNTDKLAEYESLLKQHARDLEKQTPGLQFEIQREKQYRNMADALRKAPQIVHLATQAHERLDVPYQLGSIRGGTDGAVFSEMGLPTPNLSVGQHNIHSVTEFASLNEMTTAVRHAVELLDLWQQHSQEG
ncbi:MAG: peptidase T [Aureliella sp.]